MAGIPIRDRAPAGLNHEKLVLLYGQQIDDLRLVEYDVETSDSGRRMCRAAASTATGRSEPKADTSTFPSTACTRCGYSSARTPRFSVLSPGTYLTSAPGLRRNDTTIISR
jgi:hypothetical protein